MHIDISIEQLKGHVTFFEKYKEYYFETTLIFTKEIAFEIVIKLKFREK